MDEGAHIHIRFGWLILFCEQNMHIFAWQLQGNTKQTTTTRDEHWAKQRYRLQIAKILFYPGGKHFGNFHSARAPLFPVLVVMINSKIFDDEVLAKGDCFPQKETGVLNHVTISARERYASQ